MAGHTSSDEEDRRRRSTGRPDRNLQTQLRSAGIDQPGQNARQKFERSRVRSRSSRADRPPSVEAASFEADAIQDLIAQYRRAVALGAGGAEARNAIKAELAKLVGLGSANQIAEGLQGGGGGRNRGSGSRGSRDYLTDQAFGGTDGSQTAPNTRFEDISQLFDSEGNAVSVEAQAILDALGGQVAQLQQSASRGGRQDLFSGFLENEFGGLPGLLRGAIGQFGQGLSSEFALTSGLGLTNPINVQDPNDILSTINFGGNFAQFLGGQDFGTTGGDIRSLIGQSVNLFNQGGFGDIENVRIQNFLRGLGGKDTQTRQRGIDLARNSILDTIGTSAFDPFGGASRRAATRQLDRFSGQTPGASGIDLFNEFLGGGLGF